VNVPAADAALTGLRHCVLVVDDEVLIAELWCMILEDMQVEVCGIARNVASAIALANQFRPKVILMDVRLEGPGDGIDAAIAIRQSVGSKVIFITGSRDSPTIARIQAAGPARVLFKPVGDGELQDAVAAVLPD
jgi:DNA-binding NarL/FixJ family response regulator